MTLPGNRGRTQIDEILLGLSEYRTVFDRMLKRVIEKIVIGIPENR